MKCCKIQIVYLCSLHETNSFFTWYLVGCRIICRIFLLLKIFIVLSNLLVIITHVSEHHILIDMMLCSLKSHIKYIFQYLWRSIDSFICYKPILYGRHLYLSSFLVAQRYMHIVHIVHILKIHRVYTLLKLGTFMKYYLHTYIYSGGNIRFQTSGIYSDIGIGRYIIYLIWMQLWSPIRLRCFGQLITKLRTLGQGIVKKFWSS